MCSYGGRFVRPQLAHCHKKTESNVKVLLSCPAFAMILGTAPADAKGCIKGAVVGGVAGHYAGRHGWLGAAAGCVIGHHEANKNQNTNQNRQQ
jgi:hypothetical protein